MLVLPQSLDQSSASACLRDLLAAMADLPDAVQVDAAQLEKFDSVALAVVLELRRQAQMSGKEFAVLSMSERLQDLARLYGVDVLLSSHHGGAPVK